MNLNMNDLISISIILKRIKMSSLFRKISLRLKSIYVTPIVSEKMIIYEVEEYEDKFSSKINYSATCVMGVQ